MKTRSLPNHLFRYLLTLVSPRLNISFFYRKCHHYFPNLKNPQTLDEKLQWMKLNYYKNNDLVKSCADKYRVREYVKQRGLDFLLNDLIAVYRNPEEIDWEQLPEKFVLKWNFGCGGNVICTDKNNFDKELAISELKRFKKIRFHLLAAEPQYDVDEKLLLCEKFIETENGNLPSDYKFYCFNGKAKFVLCCLGRGENRKPDFYFFDRDWTLQRLNAQGKAAPENFSIPKPEGIDALFDYAEKLAEPFPFVRADFYLEKGKAYFGELTFTPGGGFDPGRLPESDRLFGSMVVLPQ